MVVGCLCTDNQWYLTSLQDPGSYHGIHRRLIDWHIQHHLRSDGTKIAEIVYSRAQRSASKHSAQVLVFAQDS